MIVPMNKVHVVCRKRDRDRLLEALRSLGVVHVVPVDPDQAVAEKRTAAALDRVDRALQVLATVTPEGDAPDLEPVQAAEEVLTIQRSAAERHSRLNALHRQVEHLDLWGDVRLEQFAALEKAGAMVEFFSLPRDSAGQVRAAFTCVLGELPGKRVLVAAVNRDSQAELPDDAEPVPLPAKDRPALRAEAAEIDAALKIDQRRLAELAHLRAAMQSRREELRSRAEFTRAAHSGLAHESLFALQGWVPAEEAAALAGRLVEASLDAAVETSEPTEDDQPPTLVRYPRWVRPIQALFRILGTIPGYREYDLAPFFMLAMPIFTAMLVGDAMYGLLFVLVGTLAYRRIAEKGGKAAPQLVLVFGLATVLWGVLTGNYFGVSPRQMIDSGGLWALLGSVLQPPALLWRANEADARLIVIQISFLLGVFHLVAAHLRQAVGFFPHPRSLAEAGWCLFLTGMFGIVWGMFSEDPIFPVPIILGLLGLGAALVVLFSVPRGGVARRIGMGLLSNIMPMINTFGDTISYIRLMAVGLASYYIASAFNGLAGAVASNGAPFWAPAALILVLAHALNIVLCLIAIFAHGVRLNMLEFSSNAGVQWAGHAYAPFAESVIEGER
ncbi:MAG TPA: hypothetical protein DCX07_01375 [Phycisphaerales bacterium]|nr:hypothetical protein [Phycisphaerales bacterium]